MRAIRQLSWVFTATLAAACRAAPQGPAPHSSQPRSIESGLTVETFASGLEHPWAVAVLPDSRLLVTERPGRLRLVGRDGRLSQPLAGVPRVYAQGQGGLLDVALDPGFAQNRTIYLSYAEPADNGTAGTAVARALLTDTGLQDLRVIYRQEPKVTGGGHFGSRVVFAPDGRIFVTQGDRFNYRNQAQDLSSLLGKVVHLNPDGSIPQDNPFVGRSGARPEIWSYGHRNMQGAAIEPGTGRLWTIEHGAAGGDELNHPEPGKNYGWPVITYGRDYNGMRIGEGAVKDGMEQPVFYWDPVIAPSGITFYTGDRFPGWKGDLLISSLGREALVRIKLRDGAVALEERYAMGARIRDVQQGNDGLLYLATDEERGRILRVSPK